MIREDQIKNVLYVGSQLAGTRRYFSWCSYPDIWYSRLQREILSTLDKSHGINISVKFYPNDITLNPNRCLSNFVNLIILEDSLINILSERDFDLIITEAPATTLLQILCTKSQVLAFIPPNFIKLSMDAKRLLDKRIFLVENEKDYQGKLKELLYSSPPPILKDLNDEFLVKYGLGDVNLDPLYLEREAIQDIIDCGTE